MANPKTDEPIHLLGPEAVRAAARAQAAKAEEDEDKKDAAKAEDEDMEDEKDEPEKGKKSKKAKSKKAEDEHDDNDTRAESEEDDEDKEKAAVLAERARCVAIFTSPEASANPALAAHLVNTGMSADSALTTLSLAGVPAAAAPQRQTLAERMGSLNVLNPGASGGDAPDMSTPEAKADLIIKTAAKHGTLGVAPKAAVPEGQYGEDSPMTAEAILAAATRHGTLAKRH